MSKKIQQKELVLLLREEGLSYQDIAKQTGFTSDYARTICSREHRKKEPKDKLIEGVCRFCGQRLTYTPGAKKKQFCSSKCRSDFHNEKNLHRPYIRICEQCGERFISYGYPKKRFCSRECQTAAMREKRNGEATV